MHECHLLLNFSAGAYKTFSLQLPIKYATCTQLGIGLTKKYLTDPTDPIFNAIDFANFIP